MIFIDPNNARKGKLIDDSIRQQTDNSLPPIFSHIEINLSGLCTRKCEFCPRSNPEVFPSVDEYMPVRLFEKIVADLQDIDFKGTIIFSAFSEPLLHQQLEDLVRLAGKYCPEARTEVITNGDPLTEKRLSSLFSAGLATLCVSMYDGPHQLDQFKAMQRAVGLRNDQIVFRQRWLSAKEHFGITLTNRGGAIEMKDLGVVTPAEPVKKPCYYPFSQITINFDGKVLLCTHDWNKRISVGDVNDSSLLEVWNNDRLKKIRMDLARANRDFSPCNLCNVDGTMMGQNHFNAWERFYGK
ncbi:MAG: radical SAM/SPASM domain-containing protein [Pseudomonadota bacterium]